jgi:membrane protease YdiL (CAAX protease family)
MSEDSSSTQALEQKLNWGPLSAVLIVLFAFVVITMAANFLVTLLPHLLGWNSIRIDDWLMNAPAANFIYVLLAESLTFGVGYWFVTYRKMAFRQVVGLVKPRWRDILLAVIGFMVYLILFVIVIAGVRTLTPINTDQEQALGFQKNSNGAGLAMAFISLVVLPPIVEEIMFRGFLYRTLRSRKVKMLWATILTSGLFASLHLFGAADGGLLWIAFVDTFVLSLVLCFTREKTGTIWACIGIHALKNGFVFVNLFLLGNS